MKNIMIFSGGTIGREVIKLIHEINSVKKKWNIKRQHYSKIDTACFDFLPTVKIA